jgi:hypothetical protein
MSTWTADIATDPSRDHGLYVELMEDEHYRARIEWNTQRQLEIRCYGSCTIPAEWLVGILEQFRTETQHLHKA